MPTNFERYRRGDMTPPPVATTVGFSLESMGDGRARCSMETDPARHGNPMGTVHGGVLCDLADAAMGMAYASTLGEGETFTTLELKINFLRPVWRATLTADGEVVHRGKTVGMVEARIADERGRVVARATSTCLTLRGDAAANR